MPERGRARFAVAVHGGCGNWPADAGAAALAGVREALAAARSVLASGGPALDAVCAAVVAMEDNPLFNAGTGCALNRDGVAEMDASVMDGSSMRCGGVGALQNVRNPVLVARKVMEDTRHVLLAGPGALAFARAKGFAAYDPVTRGSLAHFRRALAAPGAGAIGDTVGAVARDERGRFAAATSTGGTSLKLPGRIGDSPVPGAGNYATRRGAASATGVGELMLRFLATKSVCDLLEEGATARSAAERVAASLAARNGPSAGIIAVDERCRVGIAHRGGSMPHAWFIEGAARPTARMRCR